MSGGGTYSTMWRWHFYAGLFVLPFVLLLSVSGSIYLFKPQIDRWEERAWNGLGTEGAVSADRQLAAALAANPGARFNQYRLPGREGDSAMVQLGLADGTQREVYVSPQGRVLGALDPETRISAFVSRLHGSLLLGDVGDWLVELAASWTIVMILTGLYMWWPRPFRPAGTFWPRLSLRGRPLLKDLHRVTGFWIAGLVLVMLVSGLPWAAFDEPTQRSVLSEVVAVLDPAGVFTTFAYVHARWSPPAQRLLRSLRARFEEVVISRTVWANVPPALVCLCRRPIAAVPSGGFRELAGNAA